MLSKNGTMKKDNIKILIGLILLPFAFALFVMDRFILAFLPHLDSVNMKKWFNNTEIMTFSLIRVSVIGLFYAAYKSIILYLEFRAANG
jgi:hypothetical protein